MRRDFPDGAPSPGGKQRGWATGGGHVDDRPQGVLRAYFLAKSLQSATQVLPASQMTLPTLEPYR